VIGLSHDWRAHMVYVDWVQHPLQRFRGMVMCQRFRGMVMCQPCIEVALRL
jgi:hypothetical protein